MHHPAAADELTQDVGRWSHFVPQAREEAGDPESSPPTHPPSAASCPAERHRRHLASSSSLACEEEPLGSLEGVYYTAAAPTAAALGTTTSAMRHMMPCLLPPALCLQGDVRGLRLHCVGPGPAFRRCAAAALRCSCRCCSLVAAAFTPHPSPAFSGRPSLDPFHPPTPIPPACSACPVGRQRALLCAQRAAGRGGEDDHSVHVSGDELKAIEGAACGCVK